MYLFTLIFITALGLTTLTRLWLASRQLGHIRAHRDVVPDDFSGQIALDAHQKAADYTSAKTRLGLVNTLLETILLLALTLGGGIQAIADFLPTWLDSDIWRGVVLILGVLLISALIELPLDLYRTFGIDARFGFNKMTPALFLTDLFKQILLSAALGIPLLLGVLWMMGKMGEHWWLFVWLAWMAFNLLILMLYPTVIAPLFNKFTPLADPVLATRIEALLTKCGFKSQGLFVMDGSKRSSHGNAYFSGFGASKQIVFFDTLLTRLDHEETEAVLAHELGHFKRRHVIKRIASMFVMSLAGLWLLGWLMPQDWFYLGLGVQTQSTASALLLFLLVSPAFTFLFHPLTSLVSRKHEFEADRYAAEQVNGEALVRALVKLYNDNAATLTPDPLHSMFYDSHPPASQRIAHLRAPQVQ
ncbi:MAG: M48 family metallopeptidase [Sulfuricellaceae bacterium]|nr:M48 family metallopeptidase [Sulfuricellaceae bacterium]